MALTINHNLMATNAANNLSNSLASTNQRVSSGLRREGSAGAQQNVEPVQNGAQQPSGETLSAGGAEQATGALLNTSDAAAASSQPASIQDQLRNMSASMAATGSGRAASSQPQNEDTDVMPVERNQSILGNGMQMASQMGLFTPNNDNLLMLLKG